VEEYTNAHFIKDGVLKRERGKRGKRKREKESSCAHSP
jgi:hypothetical protein